MKTLIHYVQNSNLAYALAVSATVGVLTWAIITVTFAWLGHH